MDDSALHRVKHPPRRLFFFLRAAWDAPSFLALVPRSDGWLELILIFQLSVSCKSTAAFPGVRAEGLETIPLPELFAS
jgi:hypothetical protein